RRAFDPEAFAALRVLTRACIAAGASSVVYGTEAAARTGLWSDVLRALREQPASEAVKGGGARVRLYGFAGLTDERYAELSRLDFNDTLRAAQENLQADRLGQAAGRFLDLWHMARALPFEDESRRQLILANIQQQLVECRRGLREYEEAARHQRMRIQHLEERPGTPTPALAAEYQSLGALLTRAEQWDEAVEAYETSLALLREEGEQEQIAAVLGELGKSLDRAARYAEALDAFETALATYTRLEDAEGAALQHSRMGAVYLRRLGNAPRAEEQFRRALELHEAADQPERAAEARVDVALCRRHLGDFPGALELLQQARRTAERRDMLSTLSRALAEVGNTYWLTGDYQQALELVTSANEAARRIGDDFQLNVNYQLLALIYWELNQYDRAHDALDVAIEAARRAEDDLEVASAHNNRGIIHRRSGQYPDALDSFGQALRIDERLQSCWGMGYDHRNIGMTLRRMGRLDEAEPHLTRAVELAESIGDRINLAKALLALAELRLDQDAAAEASDLFTRALEEATEVYLPEVEWRALRGLGRMRRRQGDLKAAWEAFREGIAIVEEMGAGLKIDEFRSGFLVNKMDLYEDAVDLLLEMGREQEAFHYSERSRARKFADLLSGQPLELRTEEEQELYRRQQDLSARIRGARQALAREPDQKRQDGLTAELERLRRQYSDLLLDMRVEHPELSGFVTVEAVTADELAEFVPDGVALVAYYMLEDRLVAWWRRDGAFGSVQVPVGREELTGRIKDFRLMVQNRELLSEVRTAAQRLYDDLLRPLEERLAGAEAICIVPHRGLHYLSFAALHDGDRFAVENWPLFYSPSASVLRRALDAEPPQHRREVRVLALGNPDVGDAAYELPFTEQEVVSIGRDFPRVTALTGQEASEERLREEIADYDVVHIGAHGAFDSANPLFSTIVLSPQQQDGLLHLYEVPALEIHAQLLSLSACQTALGELRSADELVSLSRAFSYAGARSILSTLWRVDDVSTALVSKHFYRHYAAHGAAESLRHAQLQVMNDGRHYHPTYWAGVLLTGDYR
ncbi:MAG: CHAT domain-containing protein, partial [Candidatus Brocadiia bacterium]